MKGERKSKIIKQTGAPVSPTAGVKPNGLKVKLSDIMLCGAFSEKTFKSQTQFNKIEHDTSNLPEQKIGAKTKVKAHDISRNDSVQNHPNSESTKSMDKSVEI